VQQSGSPLIGVFHAAGVLANATVRNQSMDRFSTVFAPKVHGAAALHAASSSCVLQLFHVYSSVAGLIGNAGATPHSAANTWLDSFVHCRRDSGLRAHAIQWGVMVPRQAKDPVAVGQGTITRPMASKALLASLGRCQRVVAICPEAWPATLSLSAGGRVSGLLLPWMHRQGAAQSCAMRTPGSTVNAVDLGGVLAIVHGAMSTSVDADIPLTDAGLDSLGAVEVRNQLQIAVGDGYELPARLLLDYPTARSISSLLRNNTGADTASPSVSANKDSAPPPKTVDDFIGVSLVRLCKAPVGLDPAPPPLVIAHSVIGDEQGFERWHRGIASGREVLVLRHPALRTGKLAESVSIHSLSVVYAQELVDHFSGAPFDLIGASLGAILAHRVALLVKKWGGNPRRLVLIDPPEIGVLPGFLRLVAKHAKISFHMAAESLVIGPHIQLGGARDTESLAALQQVLDEVRSAPEHALPFILARAGLSEHTTLAQTQQAVCGAAIRIKVHQQLIQLVWDEWSGRAPPASQPFSFTSARGGPAIFMVTASERGAFFSFLMTQGMRSVDDDVLDRMTRGNASLIRKQFSKYENAHDFRKMLDKGDSLQMIQDDFGSAIGYQALEAMSSMVLAQNNLDRFGPRAMELELLGQHFDVVMTCIARRDENFRFMSDKFLAPDSFLVPRLDPSEIGHSPTRSIDDDTSNASWYRWLGTEFGFEELLERARKCLRVTAPG